ncbi:MAG: sensor domain-containing diguanylate cyclase [Treponema sp.]|nr:sensor domain-containing diguanylate cyclase [Treponema sp.]
MKQKIPIIILIAASLVLLALITPSFLHNKSHEISNNQLVASHIYGLIEGNIQRPIGIASGLSSDEFLVRALEREDKTDLKSMEEMMASYLTSMKNQFGYEASYVVSEKTKRFYTNHGIEKIVNPQVDPYDNWYPMFLESGQKLQVESNRDQLFDYRWSIFVNARIIGAEGKTIGVCGIALPLEDWKKMLLPLEKEYRVKINLIDTQGLVHIDTDFNNLRNAYISEALLDNANDRTFTHTEKGRNGFRMTRFIQNLNWYLVVQGNNYIEAQIAGTAAIILINIFLLMSILLIILDHKKFYHHDLVKSSLPEDELTGLPNRNYLKESYGELGVFNTTRYKSLAVFDIDHFKIINDGRDGDKIILGIVDLAKKVVDERGIIFRWSGDEFVLFLEMDSKEAIERFNQFCENAKKDFEVTVSVGIVDVDLSATIKTNYYRAVQACYAIKESGGNGVGKR